jgi:hypothetical protein
LNGHTTAIQDKAGFKFLATRQRELFWFGKLAKLVLPSVKSLSSARMLANQDARAKIGLGTIGITIRMKERRSGRQHAIDDIDDLTFINLSVSLARFRGAVLPILIRILPTQRPQDPHRATPIPAPKNCPMVQMVVALI